MPLFMFSLHKSGIRRQTVKKLPNIKFKSVFLELLHEDRHSEANRRTSILKPFAANARKIHGM